MEERRVLRDDADALSQGFHRHGLADILVVDEYLTGAGLVETVQEAEDGRLAAA